MTFDEWWDAICEEVWLMDGRESADFARAAWDAATKEERERCAAFKNKMRSGGSGSGVSLWFPGDRCLSWLRPNA